jgi:hypothetical protein
LQGLNNKGNGRTFFLSSIVVAGAIFAVLCVCRAADTSFLQPDAEIAVSERIKTTIFIDNRFYDLNVQDKGSADPKAILLVSSYWFVNDLLMQRHIP